MARLHKSSWDSEEWAIVNWTNSKIGGNPGSDLLPLPWFPRPYSRSLDWHGSSPPSSSSREFTSARAAPVSGEEQGRCCSAAWARGGEPGRSKNHTANRRRPQPWTFSGEPPPAAWIGPRPAAMAKESAAFAAAG
jgi:hypothetical protein